MNKQYESFVREAVSLDTKINQALISIHNLGWIEVAEAFPGVGKQRIKVDLENLFSSDCPAISILHQVKNELEQVRDELRLAQQPEIFDALDEFWGDDQEESRYERYP